MTDGDSVEIKLEPPDTGILDCEMSGSGFHSGLDTCPQPDPGNNIHASHTPKMTDIYR